MNTPCPHTGGGVHRWLLCEANRCRSRGLHPETVQRVLRESTAGCGRSVPAPEIAAAVRRAFDSSGLPAAARSATSCRPGPPEPPKWPAPDEARIAEIVAGGFGLVDLWENSPLRLDDNTNRAEALLDALFPGNPLLCIAAAMPADAVTAPRESYRGRLAESALVVPSPMSALTGTTKDGRQSPRCLANVGPRRFLVVEFDNGDLDGQAARLWHLAQLAPLTIAVHSGGKSVHGWFATHGKPDSELRQFMRRAVALGADPATWTACQFVRLPDGRRDDGRPQRCFYFNPATLGGFSA